MRYFILSFILTFLVFDSFGQNKIEANDIDSAYFKCVNQDGSTVGLIGCANSASKQWEILMNKYYNLLMTNLDTEKEKNTLKVSQDTWLKFKDTELQVYHTIFNLEGTMWSVVRAENAMNLMKGRSIQLKGYYDVLNQH
jgi:uncharacterized protein YecT (DUF1311 family)